LQTARKNGQEFALAAISEGTRRVLSLARLDKVFTIFDALQDGLKKLG
jgi:anti-anti-sigma regulatory factor